MTNLVSKKPLQLAHFGYEDAKILGTKVWGGSLDFNLWCFEDLEEKDQLLDQLMTGGFVEQPRLHRVC